MKKGLVNQLIYGFMRVALLPVILILSLATVLYAEPTNGQGVLNRRVTLSCEQKEIKNILSDLSKQAEIKFVYSAQKIPARKKVTLTARDEKLGDVLHELFSPLNIFYYVSGTQIVLMRMADAPTTAIQYRQEQGNGNGSGGYYEEDPAKTVSGKVTNALGDPLAGVSVTVRGTNRGTSTAADGSFSISVEVGEIIDFSMVGYKVFSYTVGESNTVNVQLEAEISNLNEIVVVGYGTQKRSTLTGAIASVNSKTLNELPVASVEQALQGRIAGLTVTNNGGPGTMAIVRIRGISSISFASDPLYVIDGFPTGNLGNFDNRDIEQVEVLKDASAAAIYGSRATNGVVMITTKKGRRDGKIHVNLDSYVGVQSPWRKIDLLNTEQYLQYERMLNGNAGIAPPPRLEPANFNQPIYDGATQTFAQTNTDWQDAYFKNGFMTQHNISVSGGNDKSRFYTSAGYFDQDAIVTALYYKRGNFRLNSDHNISKVFTIGQNLLLSYSDQYYDNTGGNRTRLVNVIRSLPYLPVYDPTTLGGFRGAENSFDGADPTNPIEDATLLGEAKRKTMKLLGTAFVQVNFTPWLNFRSTFGVDYVNTLDEQFSGIFNDKGRNASVSTINNQRTNSTTLLYTQQLTFDKTFGDHHLNVTGVFESQSNRTLNEQMRGNQSSNAIRTLFGATNVQAISTLGENLIVSYIGRVTYDFAGKYLLNAALRRDGLSVWAPGNKFRNFPSISAGWRLDQEEFLQRVPAISELKITAGYGSTGLNGLVLGNYPWQAPIQANNATYPFNNVIDVGNGSYYNQIPNPNMIWETTDQLNIGLSLGLWNNKLTFVADFYNRKTNDLLLSVPTPGSFGYNGAGVLANVGSMKNTGLDVQIGYNKTGGEFTWNLTGNLSIVRNKVLKLNTENASIEAGADQDFGGNIAITRTVAGQPIQSFYGYVMEGIFQSDDEVANSPVQVAGQTAAGDLKFKDLDGDGFITDADRTFIGNYLPDFSYALNYSARYKNWDFSLFFQGVQGNDIFNAARIISEGMARLFGAGTRVLDAWRSDKKDTDMPRAISGDPNQNLRVSTRWIEDGSYLRLKNIMLGYNIPANTLRSLTGGAISSFRLYVSSQNLFTITNYKGWDPEIGSKNNQLTNGIDYGQYPNPRAFQFGVQVGF
jgi:TonB-linked SusC/RagA family outer membrane protein